MPLSMTSYKVCCFSHSHGKRLLIMRQSCWVTICRTLCKNNWERIWQTFVQTLSNQMPDCQQKLQRPCWMHQYCKWTVMYLVNAQYLVNAHPPLLLVKVGNSHRRQVNATPTPPQYYYAHLTFSFSLLCRFLRGTCKVENCPFSHKVSKEKMPVCAFFLRGVCTRENCPYLHVKVSQGAEICKDFVNGFCPLAEKVGCYAYVRCTFVPFVFSAHL